MAFANLTDSHRAKRLQLARTPNVGAITYAQLMARFQYDIDAVLEALPELSTRAGKSRNLTPPPLSAIEDEIAAAAKQGVRYIAFDEQDFPAPLAALTPPPPMIAVRGQMEAFAKPGIAIVGSRNASAAGRKITREIAEELAASGYTIVSGLARGIDGEAHAAALKTGTTIAVLAGGPTSVYPPEHSGLYQAILEHGAIVSETPFGYTATARDFPKRNRLITGLALGVVVCEAALRSGSLISARTALEQGREVMAVPGSPLDERTRGSNGLIKQGAWLIENAKDVINALEGSAPLNVSEKRSMSPIEPPALTASSPSILHALQTALSPTPIHVEELSRVIGADVRTINAALTELELGGVATTSPGGMAALNLDAKN